MIRDVQSYRLREELADLDADRAGHPDARGQVTGHQCAVGAGHGACFAVDRDGHIARAAEGCPEDGQHGRGARGGAAL